MQVSRLQWLQRVQEEHGMAGINIIIILIDIIVIVIVAIITVTVKVCCYLLKVITVICCNTICRLLAKSTMNMESLSAPLGNHLGDTIGRLVIVIINIVIVLITWIQCSLHLVISAVPLQDTDL